jgi:DNA polymerase V
MGIGPTKTIAKLGNRLAKDDPTLDGVFDLRDEQVRQRVYERTPIGEIWASAARRSRSWRRRAWTPSRASWPCRRGTRGIC